MSPEDDAVRILFLARAYRARRATLNGVRSLHRLVPVGNTMRKPNPRLGYRMKQITWAKATWWFMLGLAVSYCVVSATVAATTVAATYSLSGSLTTHHYNGDGGGPPSYLKYKIPGTEVPCCNASDCKLATKWHVDRKTGDYMVYIDERDTYYRVEKKRIIYDNVSNIHICYTLNGTERGYQVRCAIIPQGTM